MRDNLLWLHLDSPVFGLAPGAIRFYFYLLSHDFFGDKYQVLIADIPEEIDSEQYLSQLLEAEAIVHVIPGKDLSKAYMEIGSVQEGLYANRLNIFKPLLRALQPQVEMLLRRKRFKTDIWEKWSLASVLLQAPEKVKKVEDIMCIWEGVYGLVFQEECRLFMAKEAGQFKHLWRFYGPTKSAQLIVRYLQEARIPSIGELLTKKDAYFHQLISQNIHIHGTNGNTGGFI